MTVADGDASYNKWLSGKPYIARKLTKPIESTIAVSLLTDS